ncbi:hypothetical protein ES708_30337 [subsurface metagenome]
MSDKQETIVYKGKVIQNFTILGCKGAIVEDSEGKLHIESTCRDKAARDKLAAVFEEEVVIRVDPKVVLEEPPVEPAPEPVIGG